MTGIRVNASVVSENPELVARAMEAFSRATIGLALDGAEVVFIVGPEFEDEPADDDAER